MRTEAVLTESELEILRQGATDPDIITDYFFRPYGSTRGWRFDENFDPEGAWQKVVCQATQKDIVVIGGFGTGKTSGIIMGAATWCLTTRDFKFLNVAQKVYQAKQMYDYLLSMARGTRFEDFIWEKPRRPWPKIVIRFRIGKVVYEASMEFMSVDRDSTGILSWEGDWVNIEEAGLIDNLEENVINLGSRIRGSIRERERLARLSMISNSWDNFWLWFYFDRADGDPENFLSIVVSSRHNHNITPDQLKRMLSRIPKDEHQRFIDGGRPEGKGTYFSRDAIYMCEDELYGRLIEEKAEEEYPGYNLVRLHGAGVIYFIVPPLAEHLYIEIGDPGIDGAPRRNAPVLMVWDVTGFPARPIKLVAFWWGNGDGKIGPFVSQMFDLAEVFRPFKIFVDSTGPQKNSAQLINEHIFKKRFEKVKNPDDSDIEEIISTGYLSPGGLVEGISGLDFSGTHKIEYLLALRLCIEGKLITWPKIVTGIRSQLSNYDPEYDRKIAQDIVATMAMSAHVVRGAFNVSLEEMVAQRAAVADPTVGATRRKTLVGRSRRSSHARPKKQQ